MATSFLHGFEFIESASLRPIQMVRSSVIGLVGTAPTGPVNQPVLVMNRTEGMVFGSDNTHSIPQALKAIFDQGDYVGYVVVVNVFDPQAHENVSDIAGSDIIGGVDASTGLKKGIEALLDASSLFGFAPKILIAPGYSSSKSVMDALIAKADTLRAFAIADSSAGATREQALAYREDFDSCRAIITYPLLKYMDGDTEKTAPFSPYLAGVMSRTDNDLGFWHSPSNKVIYGITATERPIPHLTFHSPNSMANYLNEMKIVTAVHHEGFRVWGNRSACSDSAWHFIPVRRQFDIIEDSIETGTLHLLDRPINKAFFEDLQDSVQAFLNSLVGRQAIIYGKIVIAPEDNPPAQIAAGNVSARIDITPTYPAERITYQVTLNIDELKRLFK